MKKWIIVLVLVSLFSVSTLFAQDTDTSTRSGSEKKYADASCLEVGGSAFFYLPMTSPDTDQQDVILRASPMVYFFLFKSFAIGIKTDMNLNLSAEKKMMDFFLGFSPQAAFPLMTDFLYMYVNITAGISFNAAYEQLQTGFFYGNELGVKFQLNKGFLLNVGVYYLFDNARNQLEKEAYQNRLIPTIGVSGWL